MPRTHVYVAADVAGAMDVLQREHIDLLLTDLRLGGDDGIILIQRALKMPHRPFASPGPKCSSTAAGRPAIRP